MSHVVWPTEKEANGCRTFKACDNLLELLLALLLLWKGTWAPNSKQLARHVMLDLLCKIESFYTLFH
jgi:hypothetical protein